MKNTFEFARSFKWSVLQYVPVAKDMNLLTTFIIIMVNGQLLYSQIWGRKPNLIRRENCSWHVLKVIADNPHLDQLGQINFIWVIAVFCTSCYIKGYKGQLCIYQRFVVYEFKNFLKKTKFANWKFLLVDSVLELISHKQEIQHYIYLLHYVPSFTLLSQNDKMNINQGEQQPWLTCMNSLYPTTLSPFTCSCTMEVTQCLWKDASTLSLQHEKVSMSN